ncbi:hypothetical protein FACS1894170_08420 [Planctomycetales bacterium]|nr:hypothetical protein FACS1894170_08420 [Planctomycetales bacterium]
MAVQNIAVRTDAAEPLVFNSTNLRIEQNTSPNQQNFQALEEHLKLLGAKTCKLEKWGSRGNLFRFSCLVTSPGAYRYEKQFQAIGADEMNVMRTVIEEIEHWKQKTTAF